MTAQPPPVRDVVLVLNDGRRVAVEAKPTGEVVASTGAHQWEIVMEVDPDLVMPDVVKIEGVITQGHCLTVPAGPGYDTPEWGHRIFANSPYLVRYDEGGHGADGSVTR